MGHIFIFCTYEGGNGGVFFSRDDMNGSFKNNIYAWASQDISRISRKRLSRKLARQSSVSKYGLPSEFNFISPFRTRICIIILEPLPSKRNLFFNPVAVYFPQQKTLFYQIAIILLSSEIHEIHSCN